VLWIRIRIRMDLHHFGNLDPHPDLHPHKKNQYPDPHRSELHGSGTVTV
jgi:hypothetical protein